MICDRFGAGKWHCRDSGVCPLLALSGRSDRTVNVRFDGNNGHDAEVTRCRLMIQSGHSRPPRPLRIGACSSHAPLWCGLTARASDARRLVRIQRGHWVRRMTKTNIMLEGRNRVEAMARLGWGWASECGYHADGIPDPAERCATDGTLSAATRAQAGSQGRAAWSPRTAYP